VTARGVRLFSRYNHPYQLGLLQHRRSEEDRACVSRTYHPPRRILGEHLPDHARARSDHVMEHRFLTSERVMARDVD